jgi:ribulose-phosphate 3-epimerase
VVSFLEKIPFVTEVHIDVVDGEFVPSTSWPINPTGSLMAVKPHTDKFTLEVDLMMKNPFPAAREWEKAGADMIVFHVETVDEASFEDFCKHSTTSVGIAFHGTTTFETVKPYLPHADYIQVMGIEEIGSQGQPFSPKTCEKIEMLKALYPHVLVSVDGSVNTQTIRDIAKAGADRVIVGSAISRAPDMTDAYDRLVQIVNE